MRLVDVDVPHTVPFDCVVQVPQRDRVFTQLRAAGFGVGVHRPPNHSQPVFRAQEWYRLAQEASTNDHAFGWFDANGCLHNADGTPYQYVDLSASLMDRANHWGNNDGILRPPDP